MLPPRSMLDPEEPGGGASLRRSAVGGGVVSLGVVCAEAQALPSAARERQTSAARAEAPPQNSIDLLMAPLPNRLPYGQRRRPSAVPGRASGHQVIAS